MGQLKQVLPYRGGTLVGHAVDQALEAGFAPVIVVVGAQAQSVGAAVAAKRVEVVANAYWHLGMGSSISAAARYLMANECDAAAVALIAADQPQVSASHLAAMRQLLISSGASAVAAEYAGTAGIPVLFRRSLWRDLAEIPLEAGAKVLLAKTQFARFPLPEAAVDVDTPEDWARFNLEQADPNAS